MFLISAWSCTKWGLPCHFGYPKRGALLPHRFILTGLKKRTLKVCGGLFSVALSRSFNLRPLAGIMLCGARTFLCFLCSLQRSSSLQSYAQRYALFNILSSKCFFRVGNSPRCTKTPWTVFLHCTSSATRRVSHTMWRMKRAPFKSASGANQPTSKRLPPGWSLSLSNVRRLRPARFTLPLVHKSSPHPWKKGECCFEQRGF
jgi:hypothetical protein